MRMFAALPLLLAGCAPATDPGNNVVDINAAAEQAQNSIDNYAATTDDMVEDDANETAMTGAAAPTATPPLAPAPTPVTPPVATPEPLDPPAPGQPGGLPDDRTPISEAPFTPGSAQGAANVVQTYYALLGEGKYRRAWALWENGGKASGMSAPAFAASFDKYSEYHANVGAPGAVDAGAGQRYVTVPVQVYGRLKAGAKPIYMLGSVTLHRTGNIDGATAEQKSWHIKSADIKPRPKAN